MPNTLEITPSIPWLKTRRGILAIMVLISSVAGCIAMNRVAASLSMGWQITMLVLFSLTFTWIALAFWGAVCGFVVCALRRDPLSLRKLDMEAPSARLLVSRTAIVMPIYAEPPIPTFAGLEATCHSLLSYAINDSDKSSENGEAARPLSEHFEVFILSDTQDATMAEVEETHVGALQRRFADKLAIHYRRRPNNDGRKVGNIADFCRRWGRNYDYMIVLDADSLMSGATLLRMVQRMQRQPSIGLIQTVPIPVGQKTLFGRFTQFASALYSPMLAAGQSFWQGDAANYWGHNAIIRTRAFMDHAGLPTLPGKPPLGGDIMSHDFVEAALLKRGGWQVILDTTITTAVSRHDPYASASHNSFEAMPSNLLDFAKRDRRWLQGNLQHLRLLDGTGLHPLSRIHFFYGAFAYLSSLVWLGLLVCTSILVSYHALSDVSVNGLPKPLSLGLLSVTLAMLLAPKLLGFTLAFWQTPHAFGGRLRLLASTFLEMLFAALLAPLMMAWHSLFIINVLLGRSIDWQTQPRGERSLTWRETWQHVGWMTFTGVVWAGAMVTFSPTAFGWLTPAWLGLVGAAPLVKYTSSGTWGGVVSHRFGLLKTPSMCLKPPLLDDFTTLVTSSDPQPLDPATQAPFALQLPPAERFGEMRCQSFRQFDRQGLAAASTTIPTSASREPN
ncbi:glucans biosynthesis glucosyltransferase MdoH [Vreelandella boliviensis]|uniref:Glucans biosynthesis glucosyltransferase H n=1 Tax=Vreelandella boliviensis LC1 TaxID=1072583 RepID=A0ABX4G921_9GAMM|nr:glucans biosynthesis glucosyltransferase MdoH [Halomonas boliviensis]OZT73867.1 glucan biosynthesis glucosyltransferase H [Halomonas boliviensis LC1]